MAWVPQQSRWQRVPLATWRLPRGRSAGALGVQLHLGRRSRARDAVHRSVHRTRGADGNDLQSDSLPVGLRARRALWWLAIVVQSPRRASDIMTHDFYALPGAMTSAGSHDLSSLPSDIASLSRIVQGLVIHQYMAPAYGVQVSEARSAESHIRHVDEMLDRILEIDPSPLTVARPPEKRLVGVCHHFSLLFVAVLRAHGIPARYRQGFGTYFNPPNA